MPARFPACGQPATISEIHEAGLAGLMLDIGTNYLPQNLNLPGHDFRNADPKIWKQHVILGHRALENDACCCRPVLNTKGAWMAGVIPTAFRTFKSAKLAEWQRFATPSISC